MAPFERDFWKTSHLSIEGRMVTIYDWPSDRLVYLCKPNDTPRDYLRVPYFNLNNPKISKGRASQETFDIELRKFIRTVESPTCEMKVVVVRCREVPWLVGFAADKDLLVPATSFINPEDMQESEPPNLIQRGEPYNAYGETVYADISGECEKLKKIIMSGTDKEPVSEDDIREVWDNLWQESESRLMKQEQLAKMSPDPNLTLGESHTIELPHLSFLKKWDNLWHESRLMKGDIFSIPNSSESSGFDCFVARIAWLYGKFDMVRGKIIILPYHEPRTFHMGWSFLNMENNDHAYIRIRLTQIRQAASKPDSYFGKMAEDIMLKIEKFGLMNLTLNKYWSIVDPQDYSSLVREKKSNHV